MNWLKILNIIVGVAFAISVAGALVPGLVKILNQWAGYNIFARTCSYILLALGIIFICSLIFYLIYLFVEFIEFSIKGIISML